MIKDAPNEICEQRIDHDFVYCTPKVGWRRCCKCGYQEKLDDIQTNRAKYIEEVYGKTKTT